MASHKIKSPRIQYLIYTHMYKYYNFRYLYRTNMSPYSPRGFFLGEHTISVDVGGVNQNIYDRPKDHGHV